MRTLAGCRALRWLEPRTLPYLAFTLGQGRLAPDTLAAALRPALNTDRWFDGVFQSAPERKAGSHRLDGVLWPLGSESGSAELPVVFLEVQMRADPGFHHRLAEHWRVVVITPHRRFSWGP